MAIYDFRIAPGWNVALGSLTNVENLPAQSGYSFIPPAIVPNYDPGIEKIVGNGGDYFSGYPGVPWFFGDWRGALWKYFYTTIGGGLWRSKVTIYTLTLPGSSTYTRYNAWMFLPKPAKQVTNFSIVPSYSVQMTRLAAL